MNSNIKAYILIALILIQNLIVLFVANNAVLIWENISSSSFQYPISIWLIMLILSISSFICLYFIMNIIKEERESVKELNNSKEVIEALRGQKHDFQNHLNVISGLIQLGKADKALDYTFNICGKTNEIFSISKIKNVEVAALLYRKYAIAENSGIAVELDIDSYLEDIKISSLDLCKILFNLIDNAIYELQNCNAEEKILSIDISQIDNQYIISITNSYPIISEDIQKKLFQVGFSTKDGEDHGHGLPIVKSIVHKNSGKITVESYEGVGTIFTVFLPK
ncbi:sensor histidine kinase [Haloimpatiens lingqiaonensis]|uniref:sensor histidine kinase n=1 Tax=Haloimpatiens lingqiaonensis TaxID=1380675 RepID=UPI0010FF01A3|nr:ATP-binding protein [Haloimpatiens lingqiaonensis]